MAPSSPWSARPAAASRPCSRSSLASSPARPGRRGAPIPGPRRDIGCVFQSPVLFPWRTVLDNVLLPIDVQRLGRDRHRAIAGDLLTLVGLAGFEQRYPWELSGGMQ